MPQIDVRNLTFTYENKSSPALDRVNLVVEKGEFALLAGPSGSGKSTLLKCINGLIPHRYVGEYSGSVYVSGISVPEAKFLELSPLVGTVLQEVEKQLVSPSVEDEVAFGPCNLALPWSEVDWRVKESLEVTGISELRGRMSQTLSGGQKQRLAIADILAMEPSILLFDEPLANLDSSGVKLMQGVFREFHASGKTLIVSEHRTEEVLHADPSRIVVINDGRIVADDTDRRILGRFSEFLKVPADLSSAFSSTQPSGVRPQFELTPAENRTLASKAEKLDGRESEELIRCEDLGVEYFGGVHALNGINISIRKGERIAILGNNGAGKSTLSLAVAGLLQPTEGRVLIRGKDTRNLTISEIAKSVALVFQGPFSMLFSKTVRREIEFGPKNIGMDRGEISEVVPLVAKACGISHLLEVSPFASSFGEKKRICVASVLSMRPKCIILDEPTAGQDYRSYTNFMVFISSFGEWLDSFIVITHDPDLAAEFTDRSIVLSDGKLLADGPTSQILSDQSILDRAAIRETSLIQLSKRYTGGKFVLPLKMLARLARGVSDPTFQKD